MTKSPSFDGFTEHDFGDLVGSTWRRRASLGGVLSKALKAEIGHDCDSWGVKRRLELHIARRRHYDFDDPWPHAKLFVYSATELAYGFYIETPEYGHKDDAKFLHWRNLHQRLQQDEGLRHALTQAMMDHELTVADYYRWSSTGGALKGQYQVRQGELLWSPEGEPRWQSANFDDFFQHLLNLKGELWVDLHIFRRTGKEGAIAMGPGVVEPILKVLRALAPVYHAATADRPA